jgi:hypothetical protein
VKGAVSFISDFEEAIAHECKRELAWGGVRAYSPCRDPQGWRGGLPQLRRLGGVVHGADRALGWHDRAVSLADAQAREVAQRLAELAEPAKTVLASSQQASSHFDRACSATRILELACLR